MKYDVATETLDKSALRIFDYFNIIHQVRTPAERAGK
jgi:hypothetical protein